MGGVIGWVFVLLAPLFGGLLYGIERKLKARMQRRAGPPLLQPFYDFFKLIDKRPMVVHSLHGYLGILHFLGMWLALAVLLSGGDLLMVIFMHLLANSFLIVAAFSVRSVYSQLGGMRQLLAILAYEPIFLLAGVGFYFLSGSFEARAVFGLESAPLWMMWGILIAIIIVMPAKLKKSPFDMAEAHQEIIGGAEIEYSGIFYEALYTARWLEYTFAYAFIVLFGGANWFLGTLLAAGVFLLVTLVDNATTRLNWQQTVAITLGLSLPLGIINLLLIGMA
jgi:ech hydrogenase subunit B